MNSYYVVYDLNDNIICYLENIDELVEFTNLSKKRLKYRLKNRLKNRDFIYYIFNGSLRKIYVFS